MMQCKAVHVYPCGCVYAEWVRPPFHPNEAEKDLTVPEVSPCNAHAPVEDFA